MAEKNDTSPELIGLGYTHWTGMPETPGVHHLALVPQSMMDGWEAMCACGEWKTHATFHEFDTRDELLKSLEIAYKIHAGIPSD